VRRERFRADLFYRLNVITFELPALRERPAAALDAMIKKFIEEFAGQAGRDIRGVTPEARRALHAYGWPGNVRELRNAIERAVALRPAGPIELTNLPDAVQRGVAAPEPAPARSAGENREPSEKGGRTLAEAKDDAEACRIAEALRRNSNNRVKAAAELGISRMTLYKKLHRYGWVDASF